jgi:GNAT superfamily N-acetyltransferase
MNCSVQVPRGSSVFSDESITRRPTLHSPTISEPETSQLPTISNPFAVSRIIKSSDSSEVGKHPIFTMSSAPPTSGLPPQTWTRQNDSQFFISTDPKLLSVEAVNAAFSRDFVYWTKGPFPEKVLWQMLHGSLSFGVYRQKRNEPGNAYLASTDDIEQIGLARVVTDGATFAYVSDTYVLPEYQGNGLGNWLVACVAETFSKENMPYLRRIMLLTDDERLQKFYGKMLGVGVVGREERADIGRDLVFMCARPHA